MGDHYTDDLILCSKVPGSNPGTWGSDGVLERYAGAGTIHDRLRWLENQLFSRERERKRNKKGQGLGEMNLNYCFYLTNYCFYYPIICNM